MNSFCNTVFVTVMQIKLVVVFVVWCRRLRTKFLPILITTQCSVPKLQTEPSAFLNHRALYLDCASPNHAVTAIVMRQW